MVHGVPDWLSHARLLGPGAWTQAEGAWALECTREEAADIQARLRGLGMDGEPITVQVRPSLKRAYVRAARTIDARRRRDTSPGFTRTGVQLDEEARYSLTPEALASSLGRRAMGLRVVDATCGGGGNAIGFARAGCKVVAIDRDGARLNQARHNARLYGVSGAIRFLNGNAATLLPDIDADLCFIDPPWDHPDPVRCHLADLAVLQHLLPASGRFSKCWLKLPPSFVTPGLPDFTPEAWFGTASGDQARVKFLVLSRTKAQ